MLGPRNGYKKESKTVDYEKAYKDLLTNDTLGMRERIVLEIFRNRPKYTAEMTTAAALTLINFIENKTIPKSVGREPSLPMDFEVFLPKDRKISKMWPTIKKKKKESKDGKRRKYTK